MRLDMQFELRNGDGETVFGPRVLSASRVYAYDPNSVIAKLDEEKIIRQELQENLVGQLFRNERSTSTKTELYIVITPRIVRHRRFEEQDKAAESVVMVPRQAQFPE